MADYSHGPAVIALVALWIVFRNKSVPRLGVRISALAIIVLILALGTWLVAYKASSAIGGQLMLPIILWSSLWAGCGLAVAVRFAAPIACLYFAIPVWEFFNPALQAMTVFVSKTVIGFFGVHADIDGVMIRIPEGIFQVAEGCAGKRYLIVTLALATFLAASADMTLRRVTAFFLITAALALITNWLRVTTIIWLGHITHMQHYLVAREHFSFGWLLFAMLGGLICLIARQLGRRDSPNSPRRGAVGVIDSASQRFARPALAVTMFGLCATSSAVAYARIESFSASSPVTHLRALPDRTGIWSGPLKGDSRWAPSFRNAAQTLRAAYRSAGVQVEVFVAEYGTAQPGAKATDQTNTLISSGWQTLPSETLERDTIAGRRPALGVISAETPSAERWLITYVYDVDGIKTTSAVLAQIMYGVISWKGKASSRIVAAAIRCRDGCDSEKLELRDFWDSVPRN
jgi:exosortase